MKAIILVTSSILTVICTVVCGLVFGFQADVFCLIPFFMFVFWSAGIVISIILEVRKSERSYPRPEGWNKNIEK